ncbi:hypothetical protein [Bosea sp. (in: a-proteobacteria)]|jgi:hypothetical protein|uniref:hypothetical protein n=1 Tax=Bosea sp. (in: a-proteobacteria) TaxID=1871050 RepID=UPI003F6F9CB0
MNGWFLAAALIAMLTCLIHAWLGGREVARPLLAANGLGKVAKFTAYYCWHLVTIVLAGLGLAFFLGASGSGSRELGAFATGCAALFCLWSLALIARFGLKPLHFPQWVLFAPMALCGAAGLWA